MPSHNEHLNFGYPVHRGQQRFRELILYIAERCKDAEFFGATKLNKILYHADFRAFRRFGIPITGAKYFRLPNGPAPFPMVPVRRELEEEGALVIEYRPVGNRTQERVVPLRAPFLDLFTKDELNVVDEVIRELWGQTAEETSDASHDIIWKTRRDGDLIPYEAVYLNDGPLTDKEIERTRQLASEFGWVDS